MATQAQADSATYSSEKCYTDTTKSTFNHYCIDCVDENGVGHPWNDTVSASNASNATLLTNAKTYFKDNITVSDPEGTERDAPKKL